MEEQRKYYPSTWQAVGLFLFCILATLPASLIVRFIPFIRGSEQLRELIGYVTSSLIVLLFAVRNRKRYGEKRIVLKRFPVKLLLPAAVAIMALGVIADPVTEVIPVPEWFEEIMDKYFKPNLLGFVGIVIAAPILEELLFRGVILHGLLKNYRPAKAILLSAFLFGLIHFNPWQFVFAFPAGILLGWIYWKTGSVLCTMILHAFNNFLGFLLLLVLPDAADTSFYSMLGTVQYIIIYVGSFLILFTALRGLHRQFQKSANSSDDLPL
jgi:membrane protease YdiL (CAAX protease family)